MLFVCFCTAFPTLLMNGGAQNRMYSSLDDSKVWLYLKSVMYLWPAILLLLQFFPQLYFCPVSIENSFYQVFSSLAIMTIAQCKCRSSRESLTRDGVW